MRILDYTSRIRMIAAVGKGFEVGFGDGV